jgi:hypothetical protein
LKRANFIPETVDGGEVLVLRIYKFGRKTQLVFYPSFMGRRQRELTATMSG